MAPFEKRTAAVAGPKAPRKSARLWISRKSVVETSRRLQRGGPWIPTRVHDEASHPCVSMDTLPSMRIHGYIAIYA